MIEGTDRYLKALDDRIRRIVKEETGNISQVVNVHIDKVQVPDADALLEFTKTLNKGGI